MPNKEPALVYSDTERIYSLAATTEPSKQDLVDAARLLLRYQGHPLMADRLPQLKAAVKAWGLDRDSLFAATRKLWSEGWRPDPKPELIAAPVGSGADVDA